MPDMSLKLERKMKTYQSIFLMTLIAVLSSYLTFTVLYKQSEPKIAILDIAELSQKIEHDDPDRDNKLKELIENTKSKSKYLWDHGYIVVKSTAVVQAPDQFFLKVD
jgi:hypothetical protein